MVPSSVMTTCVASECRMALCSASFTTRYIASVMLADTSPGQPAATTSKPLPVRCSRLVVRATSASGSGMPRTGTPRSPRAISRVRSSSCRTRSDGRTAPSRAAPCNGAGVSPA